MTSDNDTPKNDNIHSIFEAHPVFGKYVSHHPSRREWLILRSVLVYGVAVVILQLIFLAVPEDIETIILPILYIAVALVSSWWALHSWNREVVVYQHGFTYREGSRQGNFFHHEITRLQPDAERMAYFGLVRRTNYRYVLVTDEDETLLITNIYSDIKTLTQNLEKYITQVQRTQLENRLQGDEVVSMGETLQVSTERLIYDGNSLAWSALQGYEVRERHVHLQTNEQTTWAAIPLSAVDQPLLFLLLLKQQQATAQEQSA